MNNETVNEFKTSNNTKTFDDELTLRRKQRDAEKSRAYRLRKKLLALRSSLQAELDFVPPEISAEPIPEKVLHKKRLNAERCRRYRERRKQLQSGASCNQDTSQSDTSTSRFRIMSGGLVFSAEEFQKYQERFNTQTEDEDPISSFPIRTAYNRTMEKQTDEPEDFTNDPLPSMSEPMEVQDAVASTLATPFAEPIIYVYKSKAQKQREYRQRIAASRTPAQAAAARKSKNERQRKHRLRQAANRLRQGQRQHAQQQSTTTAVQPDELVNLTNEPLFPEIPVPIEVPMERIIAAPKTKAQIQREYRQRIAASMTPAQVAAAREARNVRDRNNRLRQAARNRERENNRLLATNYWQQIICSKERDRNNRLLVIASGSLEATTTSSSRSEKRYQEKTVTKENDTFPLEIKTEIVLPFEIKTEFITPESEESKEDTPNSVIQPDTDSIRDPLSIKTELLSPKSEVIDTPYDPELQPSLCVKAELLSPKIEEAEMYVDKQCQFNSSVEKCIFDKIFICNRVVVDQICDAETQIDT